MNVSQGGCIVFPHLHGSVNIAREPERAALRGHGK